MNRSSSPHTVAMVPGGSGSLMTMSPSSPAGTGFPPGSTISTWKPGFGFVDDPALRGNRVSPKGFAVIGQPVSVCHQLSTTGISRPVASARIFVVHS